MTRTSTVDVGLLIARAWSLRSTCPRRQVGCILVDDTGHPLSSGYNGPASGQLHCTEHPCPGAGLPSGTGLEKCEAIHAEANALLRCPDVTRVHACFVTHSPCLDCVKLLLNTGCRHVFFEHAYSHDEEAKARWLKGDAGATRRWTHVAEPDYAIQRITQTLAPPGTPLSEIEAWAAVDTRYGEPGERHVEFVTVTDKFGLPAKGMPPQLPGWKMVRMRGAYEEDGE